MKIKVIFVCLGNICRSPMAEAIFRHLVDQAGLSEQFEIDSAGTGSWHVGDRAHPDTRRVLSKNGLVYNGRARRVQSSDVADPDTYVVAMDGSNESVLRRTFGDIPRLVRLLDFADNTRTRDVPDPYYEGNFDYVYQLVEDGCRGLLQAIREHEKI